ncbi:DUF1269 domain-containing protein [Kitasatospora sp. NBC_00085]|uniref:DUF1269 domain-containing protein n=1 Tax=unclassified Kitasatospora TaxID=2633591 RepID=UPI003244F29A
MSNLFAIAYPDLATAQAVRNEAVGLQTQKLIDLEDAVVVERATADKVVPALARYGGRIIQTSLSVEAEAELRATVEASRPQSAQASV